MSAEDARSSSQWDPAKADSASASPSTQHTSPNEGWPRLEAEPGLPWLVMETMAEGLTVSDASSRFEYVNPAFARLLGRRADELMGRMPDEFTAPAAREHLLAERAVRFNGQASTYQSQLVRRDGHCVDIAISAVPRVVGGAVVGSIAVITDITERQANERRLQESEARLSRVFDGSNDGYWDWQIPSGHVFFSARWAAMLGYELQDLEPHVSSWERIVHPDDMPLVQAALERHLRGDTAFYESEHRVRHKDGRWVWVLDRGKVVERDAAGRPVRAAGTHSDITERKNADEKLRVALARNDGLVADLRHSLEEVKTLSGFLPICSNCKKVRDDAGYWQQIEAYVASRTGAQFSHGLCPECLITLYPDFLADDEGSD
jgi:PAS domain S-box-containing protein